MARLYYLSSGGIAGVDYTVVRDFCDKHSLDAIDTFELIRGISGKVKG